MDSQLSVSLLGPFQASFGGQPLPSLRTAKVQALLVYLLVEVTARPKANYRREALMELLWPGLPLKSAQENLRQTVYQLRKALAGDATDETQPPFLLSDRQFVQVNPARLFELDVAAFTQLLSGKPSPEQLEQAVSLYRGDFLADFYLPDSAAFEDWAATRREEYRRRVLAALEELTAHHLLAGNADRAEQFARRSLEIERLDEVAHQQLVSILAAQGQRNAALSHYEAYRRLLADELGLAPGPDITRLVEQIRSGEVLQAVAHADLPMYLGNAAPFVSRQREIEHLQGYLSLALAGQPRVAFITGEAGAGKTALLHEFARRSQAATPNLLTGLGSCNAFTGAGDPYLPFRDILRLLDGEAGSAWASGAANRELLHEQYTQALLALAARRPLLILLDDLQWADAASLSLLFHLGRRLEASRILILGAYRPSEVALGRPATGYQPEQPHALETVVNELKRRFGNIQVDLDRFAPQEGRMFVDAYLDEAAVLSPNAFDEDFRVKLFWRTKGHPLFTVELLREMQERGDLAQDDMGRWEPGPGLDWDTLPARVEAVIQQRTGRLDETLRLILSAACVEGEEFTAQTVARVQQLDERLVLHKLSQELEKRHGLVRGRGEVQVGGRRLSRFQFSHALFQQYLYQQLNQGERRLLHGEIAAFLAELCEGGKEPVMVQLAHHYAEAGEEAKAAIYMLQAGDRARNLYAHHEAITHYRRLIPILKELGDSEAAAKALMKLGLTYHNAFDYEASRQAYDEGFVLWRQVEAGQPVPALPPAPHPLRVAWVEPSSLDPSLGGLTLSAPIVTQLFSGLVGQSPQMEVVPDVARTWDVLEGGHKYVFHLRDDVFWSDGQQLTAADFVYTFKRALDPATRAPVAGVLLYGVKGAREFHQGLTPDSAQVGIFAPDETTLVIEMEEQVSYFLQELSYYVLLPVPRHVVQAHGEKWAEPEHIVTNGPFRLASWEQGQRMVLERNPIYHGRYTGNLQQVELTLDLTLPEQFARYRAGSLDFFTNWFFTATDIFPVFSGLAEAPENSPVFSVSYLLLNCSRTPVDDVRVRRAFAMAVDRQSLAQGPYPGYELPATGGFTPPGMPGHSPGIGLSYDPQQARRLLAEAGYPGGRGFPEVTCYAYHTRQRQLASLITQWREVLQVEVTPALVPGGSLMDVLAQEQPEMAIGGWWADYADPDNFLRVCVEMDVPEWHDAAYRVLLDQARRTSDQEARMQVYRQADNILMQSAVIIPLTYGQGYLWLKPWVKNFETTAIKNPGFWKDVIIEPHEDP